MVVTPTQADAAAENQLSSAKLVGVDGNKICAWFGGYGFNVFDTSRDFEEVDHFTSGQLSGLTDKDTPEAREYAKRRMEKEGFEVLS